MQDALSQSMGLTYLSVRFLLGFIHMKFIAHTEPVIPYYTILSLFHLLLSVILHQLNLETGDHDFQI